MRQAAAAATIAFVAALLATACGGGSSSAKVIGPKELERDIAAQSPAVSDVHCGSGAQGWTFVCHLTYAGGARKKLGFQVFGASVARRSEEVAENASLAALRTPPTGAYANTADRIESACLNRRNESRDLPQPQTRRQYENYLASVIQIEREYRANLAKLHDALFRPGDAAIFAHYLRLLRADNASLLAARAAFQHGDRPALVRLGRIIDRRNLVERTLLSRVGATCPS